MIFKTSPVRWPRVDDLLPFSSNFLQSYKPLANTDDGIEGSRENEINQSFFSFDIPKMYAHLLSEIISCRNVAPREIWVCGPWSYSHGPSQKKLFIYCTQKFTQGFGLIKTTIIVINIKYWKGVFKKKKKHLRTIQTMTLGYEGKSL